MAKATLEIPQNVLDKASQQTIKKLQKEITSLEAKLKRRDEKIAEMEKKDREGAATVEAVSRFLEDIRYDEAYYDKFNRHDDFGW